MSANDYHITPLEKSHENDIFYSFFAISPSDRNDESFFNSQFSTIPFSFHLFPFDFKVPSGVWGFTIPDSVPIPHPYWYQ